MQSLLSRAVLLSIVLAATGCDAIQRLPDAERDGLEVAVFEGGYGIGWHRGVAAEFTAETGMPVDLWGDPRLDDKLKPRLLRGDPPDVILAHYLPLWLLIANGQVHPLNEALAQPAPGADGAWGEAFFPGMLDAFSSGGAVYAVPNAFGAWMGWYDARMFREHGWEPPETWQEFLDLCAEIRAAGIAPLTFQGRYPIYGWWTLGLLIHRCGGTELINRLNALEPGAFEDPDAVRAARMLQELALEHFQPGALAMTHTESQLQFVNGRAAMVFCGVWLENEMRASIPPGFELTAFNVPAAPGGKGNPTAVLGEGTEFLFVPAGAAHPEEAAAFCRFMVSPARAESLATDIGVISPLAGATPRSAVSPALASVLDIVDEAGGIFALRHRTLLPRWANQVLIPQLGALLEGRVTPEAFCAALERGVQAMVADPDVIIPPAVAYDPASFGEPMDGVATR